MLRGGGAAACSCTGCWRAQVRSLWDSMSCAAVLRLVRGVVAPAPGRDADVRSGARKGPARGAATRGDGEDMDVDGGEDPDSAVDAPAGPSTAAGAEQERLAAVLGLLAALLRAWPLRDQPDVLRSVVEALAEAAISPQATGRPPVASFQLFVVSGLLTGRPQILAAAGPCPNTQTPNRPCS